MLKNFGIVAVKEGKQFWKDNLSNYYSLKEVDLSVLSLATFLTSDYFFLFPNILPEFELLSLCSQIIFRLHEVIHVSDEVKPG